MSKHTCNNPTKVTYQKNDEQLCFIQFTHPGGEHNLLRKEKLALYKEWNYGKHQRKFMKVKGAYTDGTVQTETDDLYFWGEWEPESKVSALSTSTPTSFPKYIHLPELNLTKKHKAVAPKYDEKGRTRQNSDPFVFDNHFLYCCCKQGLLHCKLAKGSIILFGSTINQTTPDAYFAIDTVFVVGDDKHFTPQNAKITLKGFVPDEYYEIMGFDMWGGTEESICYKGATIDNPISGMYSFVPCKVGTNGKDGFERPHLKSADLQELESIILDTGRHFITDNLNSAPKKTILVSLDMSKIIYDKICKIIINQGFVMGVQMNYKKSFIK